MKDGDVVEGVYLNAFLVSCGEGKRDFTDAADACDGAGACDAADACDWLLDDPGCGAPSTSRGLAPSQENRHRTSLSAGPLVRTKAPAGACRLW